MRYVAGVYVGTVVLGHVVWALIIDAVQRWVFGADGYIANGAACFEKDSE